MTYFRYASDDQGVIVRSNYDSDGNWIGEGPKPDPTINLIDRGPVNYDLKIPNRQKARRPRSSNKIKKVK